MSAPTVAPPAADYLRPEQALAPPPIGALPGRERPDGPVTTARLRRTAGAYAATVAAGGLLARAAGRRPAGNAAVGLIAPGAGYLSGGRPLAWAATQAGFATSLVAWLGSGNLVAPVAVWLGTAADAGRREVRWPGAGRALPLAAGASLAGAWALRERGHRRALERRARRSALLDRRRADEAATATATAATATVTVGARRGAPPAAEPRVGPELRPDELAFSRFLLDRALQPLDEFAGFDRIEQFQTSSIRYQLTTLSHALSAMQYARTPAFHGYLSQAQRNLIDKWQARINWSYWAKESLWGHLRHAPDPVPRDNIMLTGWLAYQIASYVSNTGDDHYSRPGSISFRHPSGQVYAYDFHGLVDALVENFSRSAYTLYPCEPNWIYALCNGYGVLPLPVHDRLHGSDHAARILPSFRRRFEDEFLSVDGRTVGIRSSLTGLSIPAMTSILSDAAVIWQLSPVFPDLSRALYEIVREEWIRIPPATADGPPPAVEIDLKGWDRIDTGNYRAVPATAVAAIGWAALEMGDEELAGRLRADADATLDPVLDRGVRHYARASTLSNGALFGAQIAGVATHRHRIAHGLPRAWAAGPLLAGCAYPEVLVARAVSDGEDLRLVLRPGAGLGRRSLELARLRPGARYRVTGAVEEALTAAADGRATIHVDLDDRRAVHVVPED
ncbi:linalool dehydratase/isomerase domain-containing protein [Patulibacter defluvii]|uniref:linalool dehydratase/isomerase domain-containing protein n=1 Tax=Patulibacter defluvii TaxID=3095358 RepID=UPI002A755875|nr:hypothetical protein [Patulibacter sp. DM4]